MTEEKNNDNDLQRIDLNFKNKINEIIQERLDNGIDKKRKSIKIITSLLPKWVYWEKFKQDAVNLEINQNE